MKKLIIFDWDDTFTLGGIEGYYQCYHAALEEVGIQIPREREEEIIHALWGRPHREVLTELTASYPEKLEETVKLYNQNLLGDTFLSCLSLVPGSVKVLEDLFHSYILTVASAGNPTVLKEKVFPHFNIPVVFTKVITSRELPDPSRGKPYPDLANSLLETCGFQSAEAVVVGDGAADVKMAQAAGIDPIVVLTGQLSREQARELGVKYIINDVTHLPSLMETL